MLNSIELFTGAGGLGMGLSLAGFSPKAVIEWDKWACDTVRTNQEVRNSLVSEWPIYQGDVREFDFNSLNGEIDLIAGGPPCQPFSLGGKHNGELDRRDMFPYMIKAIREKRPKAFIIENVKGLTRKTFAEYFQYINLQLEFPDCEKKPRETWLDHLSRLEREKTSGSKTDKAYEVLFRVLNAADYGVPQKRERIFFVGFRHDLHTPWNFPAATHSYEALLHSQWISGEYWERHNVSKRVRPSIDARLKKRVARLEQEPCTSKSWVTVRDALTGLPSPRSADAKNYLNHKFQAGAKVYPGHTGSPIDLPAKTLKAGVHGVPGGENMLVMPNGSVRYFSVREAARLQTFPDTYRFDGSWTEIMRQLGNAVPVKLGNIIAASVAELLVHDMEHKLRGAVQNGAEHE